MLENLRLPEAEPFCSMVTKATETFDTKDQQIFFDALKDTRWSAPMLSEKLTELGFELSPHMIKNHRSGKCRCAR